MKVFAWAGITGKKNTSVTLGEAFQSISGVNCDGMGRETHFITLKGRAWVLAFGGDNRVSKRLIFRLRGFHGRDSNL